MIMSRSKTLVVVSSGGSGSGGKPACRYSGGRTRWEPVVDSSSKYKHIKCLINISTRIYNIEVN